MIATLFRFGWGYLAADERLCLAYLAEDQQRAGELLLWLGVAYAVAVAWRPMFGYAPRASHTGMSTGASASNFVRGAVAADAHFAFPV